MKLPIYLDNHSTTPLDPEVLKSMMPYFTEYFGNASSKEHQYGWIAEEAVNVSRETIAGFIGAKSSEIIFTSGTTESNNMVLKSIAENYKDKNHIITSAVEHPSVIEPLKYLGKRGIEVTFLPVDRAGLIDLNRLEDTITGKTLLVSVMTANNEIGTIQPVKEIGEICSRKNILFHTDAAQAIGRVNINAGDLNADFISFGAHKNYGPKGIGALFIRKKNPKLKISPLLHGGGHEKNLRSGTLNVPAIVGFGKCIEISGKIMPEETERIKKLRDNLLNGIFSELEDVYLNGHPENRLVNNLNISLKHTDIDKLLIDLRDIAVSTGSACSSGNPEGSYVLKALGLPEDLLKCSIRFGLGRFNTEQEINFVIDRFVSSVKKIRQISYYS